MIVAFNPAQNLSFIFYHNNVAQITTPFLLQIMSTESEDEPICKFCRQDVLYYLDRLEEAKQISGGYLSFLEIPIIERFGQWRFAGSATNFGDALLRLVELIDTLYSKQSMTESLAMLKSIVADEVMMFPDEDDWDDWSTWGGNFNEKYVEIGEYQDIVWAEGGAPYDDRAINIVEVADLANHPYVNSPIEKHIPQAWLGGDWESELDEDGYDSKLGNLFVHRVSAIAPKQPSK
jgi:hypothetical protein